MHSDFTQSESISLMIPSPSVASSNPAPSQMNVESTTMSAQFTILISIIRCGIDAVSAARRKSILITKTSSTSNLPLNYIFAVRVAHAAYKPSSLISEFITFQES
jgi:hypothetical protein